MGFRNDKEYNETLNKRNRDRIDEFYDGYHEGYTYMGGGYYSNDNVCGSDEYVTVSESGRKEYHTSM